MRTLLIDADDLAWRAALRCADGAEGVLSADLERRVEALRARFSADRIVLALSDRVTWRHEIYPEYKAHRAHRPRPPALGRARELLFERWGARRAPGLEADDVLGVMATGGPLDFGVAEECGPALETATRAPRRAGEAQSAPEGAVLTALRAERAGEAARLAQGRAGAAFEPRDRAAEERVVLSPDKDLLCAPGLHGRADGSVFTVTPEAADRQHALLTLMGDASDGYPGCPGIGAVRAARLLDAAGPEPAARWTAVLAAFRAAGRSRAEATTQARLARVLRRHEIDAAGRPILFSPPR